MFLLIVVRIVIINRLAKNQKTSPVPPKLFNLSILGRRRLPILVGAFEFGLHKGSCFVLRLVPSLAKKEAHEPSRVLSFVIVEVVFVRLLFVSIPINFQ